MLTGLRESAARRRLPGSGLYFIVEQAYADSITRSLRLEYPDALYHLTARSDRREPIFEDDGDDLAFIDLLAKEVMQQGWVLYAFCLMGNHYHLLRETPESNLVKGMRQLGERPAPGYLRYSASGIVAQQRSAHFTLQRILQVARERPRLRAQIQKCVRRNWHAWDSPQSRHRSNHGPGGQRSKRHERDAQEPPYRLLDHAL